MVWVEALIPFDKGELLSTIHQVGMVERTVSICGILNLFIFVVVLPLICLCSLSYKFLANNSIES